MKKLLLFVGACLATATLSAQVATVNIDDIVLSSNTTNYQSSEKIFNVTSAIASGDQVAVTVTGKISAGVEGLQAFLVECSAINSYGWTLLSATNDISTALAAGDAVNLSFTLTANAASQGTEIRLYLITKNAPVAGTQTIAINASGVAPEPPYEDPILGTLTSLWGNGNAVNGKTMTYGASDTGIGFANYSNGFDLSAYKTITVTMDSIPSWATYIQAIAVYNDDTNKSFAFVGATATINIADLASTTLKQLYIQCGGTGNISISSIAFEETGTAINTVENAAFAIEGGMVASAGEIVIYNVAGQIVATASQNFNVNSLAKGVYFITAQEGIIKFVK